MSISRMGCAVLFCNVRHAVAVCVLAVCAGRVCWPCVLAVCGGGQAAPVVVQLWRQIRCLYVRIFIYVLTSLFACAFCSMSDSTRSPRRGATVS